MPRWVRQLCSDKSGAINKDTLVLTAAMIALIVAVGGAMRTGTFEAIAQGLKLTDAPAGCVRTGESGATDLSDCLN